MGGYRSCLLTDHTVCLVLSPMFSQTILSAWSSLLTYLSVWFCVSADHTFCLVLSLTDYVCLPSLAWWYPDLGCPASQCLPVVLLLSGEQEMLPGPGPALYSRHSQWHSQSVSGRVARSTVTCNTQHSTLGDHVITNTLHHNQHKTHIWSLSPGERSVRGVDCAPCLGDRSGSVKTSNGWEVFCISAAPKQCKVGVAQVWPITSVF